MYISEETLDRFIHEDVPYLDLTTQVLGIGYKSGNISFITRESGILSGSDEAARILRKLDVSPGFKLTDGAAVTPGQVLLQAQGPASSLHSAWKVCLNILEYCSGIATRTRSLLDQARTVNPGINILATRKMFPGTRELSIKSVLAGGGWPHRLGLSETILIFDQHMRFLSGIDELVNRIPQIRQDACEKKIIVEVQTLEQAFSLAAAGVDGLQFDKLNPKQLKNHVEQLRKSYPDLLLIGAGGIKESNVIEYAATGVDAIVTTSMYFGRPLDIAANLEPA